MSKPSVESEEKFFVMLSLSNGGPTPMVDENDDPALFDTEAEAIRHAENNALGQAFHFEIYSWKGNL